MVIFYPLITILILIILGFLFFFLFKKIKKGQILSSLEMVLFSIIMPRYELKKEEQRPREEKAVISQMEQIYVNFLYLRKLGFFERIFRSSPKIALEIASQLGEKDISFYVAVPRYLENAFEKYINGVYPRALVEKIPGDYTIFEPGGVTNGSYLKLKEPAIFPISTYQNLEKDPLSTITNALTKIEADEGAAIQIIIKPTKTLKKTGNKILNKIKEGKSIKTAILETSRPPLFEFFLDLINVFISKPKEKKEGIMEDKKVDEKVIQAIQQKIQKQVFEANIRLVTSAQTKERAEEILEHLQGAFNQFSLFGMNSFEPKRIKTKNLKKFVFDFSFRNFNPAQKNILNIEELASIYHFPGPQDETPHLKMAKSGFASPPVELPEKGVNLIGKITFRGEEKKVYFACRDDRRRHSYIIGQTGTGKSTLLREMIRQDIESGQGVGVIDPHGELIEATLANIPEERIEDVILFEPFDFQRPMGLNMLEYDSPEQKDFAVQEMIAIFYKLFPPEFMGPMFEHYMRNAMLALMADKENIGTLVELPRIFTEPEYMKERLEKVTDPLVRSFWLREWQQTTGQTKSDMLTYVISKIGRFVYNEMMRNIIGQSASGFNLEQIMNEGKIFLANLSKGLTGEVNSSLLGLILVSKMQMAAMKRAKMPEDQRKDFYLYVDEFQNFTTDSVVTILSEARKYRLNLILAHQYIPQLKEEIRNAVLGNVGTIAAFRIGADDAEFLEKQFEPEFSRFDLVNLDNFNLIIKMLINNKVCSPFRFQTVYPQKGKPEIVDLIKEITKLKYGRAREIVELEIIERSKLGNI